MGIEPATFRFVKPPRNPYVYNLNSILYSFFWVNPRRLNFFLSSFLKTLFHLPRLTPPMKMEQCSETSVLKIQKPGNHTKEYNIQNKAKVSNQKLTH
jgi:hypothetical protein